MITTLARLLPIALAGAFLPTWTRDTILLLGTGKPPWNSVAFVAGNAASRIAVGLTALFVLNVEVIAQFATREGHVDPRLLAIGGAAFIALAVVTFARHPRTESDPESEPGWLAALGRVPWYAAFGLGFGFVLLPGVQYVYFASGLTLIASAGLGPLEEVGALAVFVIILEGMLLAPLAMYAVRPQTSKAALGRFRDWIGRNSRVVGGAILGVIGAALLVAAAVQSMR